MERAKTAEAFCKRLTARRNEAGARAWSAYHAGVREFANNRGQLAVIGPDPSKPGAWRDSRFDAHGPTGHIEAPDDATALARACRDGFCYPAPGTLDAWSVGRAWGR